MDSMSKVNMDSVSKTEMDTASISGSAKGLVKGVALVDLIAQSPDALRATDISAQSGMPHSTTIRLLDVLARLDLIRADAAGRYTLGPHVASWGTSFLENLDVAQLAEDIIQGLVDETRETSFVGVLNRDEVLYVAAVRSPHPVRPAATVGFRNPLHCTGIGKAILSRLTPEHRGELLAAELERRTENTITDRDALAAELETTRERGYAIDEIENEEGVRCVAAPVLDHRGEVIAAVSVSAPAYRFSRDDVVALAPRVIAAAGELSRRIGGSPDSDPRNRKDTADD